MASQEMVSFFFDRLASRWVIACTRLAATETSFTALPFQTQTTLPPPHSIGIPTSFF